MSRCKKIWIFIFPRFMNLSYQQVVDNHKNVRKQSNNGQEIKTLFGK